jgi:ABC-type glycerol-3-phosphate transport system substrate-binding protein
MEIGRRKLVGLGLGGALAAPRILRAAEPVTLQFWEGHSLQEETATIRMISAFEASHPGINIQRTKVAFGSDFEKITTAVASGTVPDVTPIWGGFLTQFADAGTLIDLRKFGAQTLQPTVYPAGWSYALWKGGIYGVPYALDPRIVAMNSAAFKEAGVAAPITLQDFYDAAKALTKRSGDTVQRYGFGLSVKDDLQFAVLNLMYANGATILDETGTKAAFDSKEAIEAADLLGRMIREGYVSAGVPVDGLRTALLGGRVAMIIDGPWIFYAASQAGHQSGKDLALDVAPIPLGQGAGGKHVNVASVGAYVVFSATKHPDEAATFATYMASPAAQQYRVQLLKTGVSPRVVNEAYAKQTFAAWPQLAQAQSYLADSVIEPIKANWTSIVDVLQPALEAIVAGHDAKETLQSAARQANRALRRS